MKLRSGWATYGAVLLISLAVPSMAPVSAQGDEKLNAGVARVSSIRGEVHRIRGESGSQVEAKINTPLLRGDTVAAGVDSQAEIQIYPTNMIRLAPGSEIQIADLTSTLIRLRVARGLVTYTVLESKEKQIALHTPT